MGGFMEKEMEAPIWGGFGLFRVWGSGLRLFGA